MSGLDGQVLYVHPYNHVQDELVPMGSVALMNAIPGPKLGLHAHELTPQHIEAATVLCLDLHWYFSVEAVHWIAAEAKRIRPDLPIVVGGITASFYAPELLARFPVDYIVQGDAEYTFPALIDSLRSRRPVPELPNLWRRGGSTPERRLVTPAEYAANDYLTFDWFPTLEARTLAMHEQYRGAPFWEEMDRYHPYIPLNRGCVFPCEGCFGSYQSVAFGQGQVNRTVRGVESALDRIEAHEHLQFVTFTGGTESVQRIGEYREVFQRRRALGAYIMHFCDLPTDEQIKMYLDAFDRIVIDFTNPVELRLPLEASGLTTSAAEQRIEAILRSLDGEPRARVGLSSVRGDATGFLARMAAQSFETIRIKDASEWALPAPNKYKLPMLRPANPAAREAHELARGEQLDVFREVSRRHANIALAYAAAPALRSLLNEPLPYDDAGGSHDLAVDALAASGFRTAYRAAYERWYVTTLDRVDVDVFALTLTPGEREQAAQPAPTGQPASLSYATASRAWTRLGPMRTENGMAGARLTWSGRWAAGDAIVVVPTLVVDDTCTFATGAHAEVPLLTLTPSTPPHAGEQVTLAIQATQHQVHIELAGEAGALGAWTWSLAMFTPGQQGQPRRAIVGALHEKLQRWVPRTMGREWRLSRATVRDGRVYLTATSDASEITLWAERRLEPRGGLALDGDVEVFSVGELDDANRGVGERMAMVFARIISQSPRAAPRVLPPI